jgi:hypothetical protein
MDRGTKLLAAVAALALAAPLAAGAGDPGYGSDDPVDPPLVNAKAPSPTTTTARAVLRVVASKPLRLQGVGFHRSELVRITVTTGKTRLVRQMRAGVRGGFAVTFASVRFEDCDSAPPEIVARGTSTGRVVLLPRDCAMR